MTTTDQNTLADSILEQAQVYASAWALVGGRFDTGDALAQAEQAKEELRSMVISALRGRESALAEALKEIAEQKDRTLIAPSRGELYDTAHQEGATKAFNQCAGIAEAALSSTSQVIAEGWRSLPHTIEEVLRLLEVVGGKKPRWITDEEPTWVIDGFELERRLRAMIKAAGGGE